MSTDVDKISGSEYVNIAVNAPIKQILTYGIDLTSENSLLGQRVKVPLGSRTSDGVILSPAEKPDGKVKIKSVLEIQDEFLPLPKAHLEWLEWLANYYQYPLGQVVNLSFPPLKKSTRKRKSQKSEVVAYQEATEIPTLSDEQSKVVSDILGHDGFASHLLFGVTGSGKTEVYLRLIEKCLNEGKQALVLVPEISLTPQLIKRFAARFPESVSAIHSHLTPREKTDQWWKVLNKETQILIGARSALFCPIENLGLIIVDEEHEPSYKQDEKLKYHARDAAIVKAQIQNCPIVLGSATPSLESWKNALEKKFILHEMKSRVSSRPLPVVDVVDMTLVKEEARKVEGNSLPFWLSPQLFESLGDTLKKGEQAALFLNRRGMAQVVQCSSCGFVYECPNCAISLTLHAQKHLVCHYCQYTERFKEHCPDCQSLEIKPLGLGTEQVEVEIKKLFPEARVARADRDEVNNREELEKLISDMETREIDILIGTQMIAKGLDFPGLTLVGLLLADIGLHLPDFRASERSYQLVTQVSGRAGRHSDEPGRVILQTHNPEHPNFALTKESDFPIFAGNELQMREQLHYPPYGRLASVKFVGADLAKVELLANNFGNAAQQLKAHRDVYESISLLGPSPAAMPKLRNKYRYHLLVKYPDHKVGQAFFSELMPLFTSIPPATKVQIDIDPLNML